jgi:hypothetical protein
MGGARHPESAPDLVHPVIGFRLWRMDDAGLRSLYHDERWSRGRQTARCAAGAVAAHDEPAPAHRCTCGIYAWYEPCPRLAWTGSDSLVAGAVTMWGRIELHGTGMRAQHVMVVALALPLSHGAKRRRIVSVAEALEAETVPARGLVAAAGRHGAPVPGELKPRFAPAPAGGIGPRGARAVWADPTTAGRATGARSRRSTRQPSRG